MFIDNKRMCTSVVTVKSIKIIKIIITYNKNSYIFFSIVKYSKYSSLF